MAPLKRAADLVLDTTAISLPDLRPALAAQFALDDQPGLSIMVVSFSYRLGLPREADLVFDVRFLRNPHYVEDLRPLTGESPAVAEYVRADPDFAAFFARLKDLVGSLLPRYAAEGKRYLTIGIGCTGGRHRSVVVAEALGNALREAGHHVEIRLRARHLPSAAPARACGTFEHHDRYPNMIGNVLALAATTEEEKEGQQVEILMR